MPTENRSSNTEQMVSVPRELLQTIEQSWRVPNGCPPSVSAEVEEIICGGLRQLRALLAKPAAQHQGEPVAVLYADGSVLTKAECGDAFETCCKVETPLYLHPPTSDGFSAEQMTVQGADGYRNGIKAAAELAADYPELAQAIRALPLPQ